MHWFIILLISSRLVASPNVRINALERKVFKGKKPLIKYTCNYVTVMKFVTRLTDSWGVNTIDRPENYLSPAKCIYASTFSNAITQFISDSVHKLDVNNHNNLWKHLGMLRVFLLFFYKNSLWWKTCLYLIPDVLYTMIGLNL